LRPQGRHPKLIAVSWDKDLTAGAHQAKFSHRGEIW